jgi:peptidyl-prolyl cis-trans isomerase D
MFDLFRSRTKAVKILLGALLTLVAISMVVTLIPGWGSDMGDGQGQVLARIGDETVTAREVQLNLQNMMRARQLTPEVASFLIPQMVNDMINSKALAYEAERQGFRVSEQEMAMFVSQMVPQLFPDGKFVGREIYARFLDQQNMTIDQFEARVREELLVSKLRSLAEQSFIVTDQEVEQAFRNQNERAQLAYVSLSPDRFRTQVSVTPEEVRQRFESTRAQYRIPEARSFDLLTIEQSKIAASMQMTDEQLRQAYNRDRDRFRQPERVRVRHILLRTTDVSPDEMAAVQKKAEDLLGRVKAGGNFADIARQNSQDPGSAANGGELGWIVRGQTVPEFEQAAFSLKPGETSSLIKTEYGFHIIQVLEKQAAGVQPFEEVRASLAEELQLQGIYQRMQTVGDQLRAELQKNPGQAQQIAQKHGASFTRIENLVMGDPVPGFGAAAELNQAITGLRANEVTPVVQMPSPQSAPGQEPNNILGVAVVTDVRATRQAELAEVEQQVRETILMEKAVRLTEDRAKELAEKAQAAGSDFTQLARQMGHDVRTTQPFSRDGAADGIGAASSLPQAFTQPVGSVFGPVNVGEQRIIGRVTDRTPADMTQLTAQKEGIRQQLRGMKAQQAMELFEDSIVARLQQQGKVRINQDAVNALVANYRRSS